VGDVVDIRGAVANQWEIGCTIINADLNWGGGSEPEYDIKDCKGVIKDNVPQSNIKLTLQDFYTIESLHCILQEFLSERDFTWKLLYNCVLQDEFRKTIDKDFIDKLLEFSLWSHNARYGPDDSKEGRVDSSRIRLVRNCSYRFTSDVVKILYINENLKLPNGLPSYDYEFSTPQ